MKKEAMFVVFCLRSFMENEHPQVHLKKLGVKYIHATPQSIADQWWFWNCENLPEKLPDYMNKIKIVNPYDYVGWGLTEQIALKICQSYKGAT